VTSSSIAESDPGTAPQGPAFRGSAVAISLVLFVASLGLRLTTWRSVFQPDQIVPFGGDAYYHMYRIRDAVERFPSVIQFDPMMNFPDGAQPIWPPTFDWVVAAVMRIVVGAGAPDALERAVMWVAPVLGAATVVVAYWLGRRFFSPAAGGWAAILLAILPAHFNYSQLGFTDHHVAVSLIATVVLWQAMRLLAEPPARSSDLRGLRRACALGLASGLLLIVWPGALIHIAILQVALVIRATATRDRRQAVGWANRFALVQGVALIVVLPLSMGNEWARWGSFSPVVLSNFQPLYLAAGALAFGACARVWSQLAACAEPRTRLVVAGLIGAGLASISFALIPELRLGASDSWAWLSRGEVFQVTVGESVPLFRRGPGFDWQQPLLLFGFTIYLVPIALFLLVRSARDQGDQLFFAWWTGAFFVATLMQRRFMDTYSVPHALLIGWLLIFCRDRVMLRIRRRGSLAPGFGRGIRIAFVAVVIALMWPIHARYEQDLRDLVRTARGGSPPLRGLARQVRPILESALWLREHSPEPTGSGYSVLGPWDAGHLIEYVARRPIVQNNFGDDIAQENFARAESYFAATDEDDAIAVVEPARVRYVLARSTGSGHAVFQYTPQSMASRLFVTRGSRGQIDSRIGDPPTQVAALARHRLVFESRPMPDEKARRGPPGFVKLFEIVPGARLVGRAAPDASIRLQLTLRSRHGGGLVYETTVTADADGRYEARLPYPNESFSPDIRTAPTWTATSGDVKASFRIPEAAVERGETIDGPDLR
jgi:dolichyl-diphosphooligosaccharide--protein glycosyltransferase